MTTASPPDSEPTRPARSPWTVAFLLAAAAIAFGILLVGLSTWFLAAVAIAGLSSAALTFNFHIPAAFVRLFAVGRTAAKYGERLVGHKAALLDQARRRASVFAAMAHAPAVRRAGWQFGNPERLADYLDDVEDVDFGRLRIGLPLATLGGGLAACLLATLLVAPLAALPIAGLLALMAVLARRLAASGRMDWDRARRARRDGAQRLGAAIASATALQAEGAWAGQLKACFAPLADAEADLLAIRRSLARLDALASLIGPVAMLSTLGAAWLAGRRIDALLAPAFVAFAWLALGEMTSGASRILFAQIRRRAARREIARWAGAPSRGSAPGPERPRLASLRLSALQRMSPDGRPIGPRLSATFSAGAPTVLVGASGCGKTSLLKQIAGWIGDPAADDRAIALSAAIRRSASVLCPHDAAILDDTVRANLFAESASDGEMWEALRAMELAGRIEEAGGLNAWITQETLSLGERQRLNLARVWLSDRPLVLLDEPAEHLDDGQAGRILERLIGRLGDRVVILSSHRATSGLQAAEIRL